MAFEQTAGLLERVLARLPRALVGLRAAVHDSLERLLEIGVTRVKPLEIDQRHPVEERHDVQRAGGERGARDLSGKAHGTLGRRKALIDVDRHALNDLGGRLREQDADAGVPLAIGVRQVPTTELVDIHGLCIAALVRFREEVLQSHSHLILLVDGEAASVLPWRLQPLQRADVAEQPHGFVQVANLAKHAEMSDNEL